MDDEYQRMAANSIAHEAFCAGQAWQQAAAAQERPCVLWKPRLFRDGNQWCALLGENIQDGVVGFGDSPDAAMWAFDEAWREKLPPAPGAQPAPSAQDDVMREHVMDAVAKALGDAYDCTRVWSAWGYGTMGSDDFRLVANDPDRLHEIAEAAIQAVFAAALKPEEAK